MRKQILLPKCNTIDNYLKVLKQLSMAGDYKCFLEVLKMILPHKKFSPPAHHGTLCTCLNVLLLECETKMHTSLYNLTKLKHIKL